MWKDSETNLDLLNFDYLVEVTKDIIENEDLSPCTIGVYGDWGSGKSSLVEMILKSYDGNDDFLCIKFNGWLFEDYEDAKTALLGTIIDKIKEKRKLSAKAKAGVKKLLENINYLDLASKGLKYGTDFFLTGGLGTIADITINQIASKLKSAGQEVNDEEIKKVLEGTFSKEETRKNLREFQNDFEELLKETKIKKLVVFIDELDRCNHDTILETLEAIRLFLFTKGSSFIIGADERQVMYAVGKRFPEVKGNHLDIGKEYLEKMIQYPIKIPQLGVQEMEFYITSLFLQEAFEKEYSEIITFLKEKREEDFIRFEITYELIKNKFEEINDNKLKDVLSISKQLSSVLSNRLNGNPRHCKRFLNSLSMRMKMAKFKKVTLDKKVLAKLMLIEYFQDDVFKKIGELQANENGKPLEIKLIEEDRWEDVETLKLWKDDTWLKNWINSEPRLSDIDLQNYFYFTRESLQATFYKSSFALSTEGENILERLQGGSDSLRSEAIKKSQNVSDFEATEILKTIFNIIQSSSTIDTQLFKSFLEWSKTRASLYSDCLSKLTTLPSQSIKISFIPTVFDFGKKIDKLHEVQELAKKWSQENPKLKKAIEEELK
ncbi:KAP family P-loop NTPase fold protein [Kaistella faecalis]|uniref:KAP family P-loop NTPase fold protein n=1 Tax=Kaistella faecalis TaxID=2852098 RepID=UPI001C48169E|nr:P-loop NTPase fold protein [Chryseobacterium faecale]UFK97745.1 KAP family NTPase [Chryseobacterium faecale]